VLLVHRWVCLLGHSWVVPVLVWVVPVPVWVVLVPVWVGGFASYSP